MGERDRHTSMAWSAPPRSCVYALAVAWMTWLPVVSRSPAWLVAVAFSSARWAKASDAAPVQVDRAVAVPCLMVSCAVLSAFVASVRGWAAAAIWPASPAASLP